MNQKTASHLIRYDLKSIALSRFENTRGYPYIVSPFSRLYLITEGEGWIMIDGQKIILEPNYLYLIPSFTPCSYHFTKDLEHYYIHFATTLLNGLNVYNLYKTERKVISIKLDHLLLERLLKINPNLALPHPDPHIYQTQKWLNKTNKYTCAACCLETRGILEQLLSRFVIEENDPSGNLMLRYNIQPILT